MSDLIERLEKATGPDRDFDRLIEESLPGVRQHHDHRMVADGYVMEANGVQAYLPPLYTASIDAALTLLPEGWAWTLCDRGIASICSDFNDDYAKVFNSGTRPPRQRGEMPRSMSRVATPAIALCIAALRARTAAPPMTEQAGDETHDWFVPDFIGYECCRRCGIVRRCDRKNRPCRGVVKLALRDHAPPMTEPERKVLAYLAEIYDHYDGGAYCGFAPIMSATGLDRKTVRRACRSLKRKGLADFCVGLWTDDGTPGGSGYGATRAGLKTATPTIVTNA